MMRSLFFSLLLFSQFALADGREFTLELAPETGERFETVTFYSWVPESTEPISAVIIHQHGCTNASPEKHPPVTGDFHWQALARKHNCALLSPQYFVEGSCSNWNDPDSGSERALMTALKDLADRSKHPEIAEAPWILWGHSGGSSWSSQMITRYPDRVLAASFRGGCSKQFGDPEFREIFGPFARDIPLLFVWGKHETVPESFHFVSWNPMNTMFDELRSEGGMVTRLIDPDSEHGCDNSRLVVIPFFDAILAKEFGDTPFEEVYGDKEFLEILDASEKRRVDPSLVWLPNRELASLWQEYSKTGHLPPNDKPHRAPSLRVTEEPAGGKKLSWEVAPDLVGGLRAYRIYRDGELWKEIGVAAGDAIATSRDATPESLRQNSLVDESEGTHTYSLTYLDAAGNESPQG